MKILVTGGAGFIGSNFVLHLLQGSRPPEELIILDKLTYAGNPQNLEEVETHPAYRFVQGDIEDSTLTSRLLREHQPAAVVNFAAETHVDRSIDSSEPFFATNVQGTLRLLESVRHYWSALPPSQADAFRFLHISTDEVYGSLGPNDPAFRETTPFAPNSPYAASKAASDHLIRAWHHTYGLPVLTVNCSNNYGPRQFPEKLIPLMILNALEGKPLPVYGDGQNVRDWLFVGDHCAALQAVLEKGRSGETYNIGGKCEIKNLDLVRRLCAILDRLSPSNKIPTYASLISFVADRPGHDRRYAIDCSKIQKELGWNPMETFDSGLEKTVRWYLENRPWAKALESRYQRQRLGVG
jgi:dTDP-glucose 4,6-dehydratase